MKKHFILSIVALLASFCSFASISGPTGICAGSTAHLYDSLITGGSWSSTMPSIATVDASGNVYGLSAGTTVIYCTSSLMTDSIYFTVSAVPAAITGVFNVCVGSTTTLADATSGGTWSSSYTYVATVNGGVVYGSHNGTTTIYYTTGSGCSASAVVTVGPGVVDSVFGSNTVCMGSSTTFTDMTPGGAWSVASSAIATINSSGIATGLSVGSTFITYSVSGTCGTAYAIHYLNVTSGTATPSVSGASTVVAGSTINLTGSPTGGVWSCSPTTVATVNPTSGVVTGVSAGTAIVTYIVSGCSGTLSALHTVSVTAFDGISGHIYFNSTAHYGPVKVWLIAYSAPNLTAIDSTVVYATGASASYQFTGEPTDTYRVKAAVQDSLFIGTGYIPTYHDSSFYWYSANVIPHTSGTSDINKDIYMAYGAVTAGPGFIAGNVTTGANKGTSGGAPVKGLMMYVFNSTTLQLLQAVRTDATGAYSFSNLPVGQTYYIFPDSLNYATTPYTSISLTTGSPSMSAASFIQHTISHTITPINVGVENVSSSVSSILAFPNPTNGKVNIAWQLPTAQEATVVVCDVTGREVSRNNMSMNAGAGAGQIDLSSLTNGLYLISVKGANVSYNNKIQVQH